MTTTKDILLDVLKHTVGLGLENIRVTGTAKETSLGAIDVDRTVILVGKLHEQVKDFVGEFGMGNLGLLVNLVKLNSLDEKATISVIREDRNGVETPTTIVFKDTSGGRDQYRFMSKEIVDQAMKVPNFKGAEWKVELQPSAAKINQLAEVAGVYSSVDPAFTVKTENSDLVFDVGSTEGGIMGSRKFAENISGELEKAWVYNLNVVLKILKLGMNGTCTMSFGEGVCQLKIDSGVGEYTYILPAMTR